MWAVPFSFEELLSCVGHLDQQRRRDETLAFFLRELLETLDDLLRAHGIRIRAQAAAEGRESGAEDHREVELRGARDDAVRKTKRRLVHHGKDEALLDLGRRRRIRILGR